MIIKYFKEITNKEIINSDEILKIILKKRKILDLKNFFNPPHPKNISLYNFDRNYKKEFKKVIKVLKEIKEKNQMIVVYTDYDADGITGGAIVWETLYLLGFKVMPYVPDRIKEGYGLSIKGIDNVITQFNPSLIITVDHGITKTKEVEYANSKGVKVIITDHHLMSDKTPQAEAIFHISNLSGSGVGYFFAKEIFKNFKSQTNHQSSIINYFISDYLALASIGTIADLVPLIGPSRSIVKYGLEAFLKIKRFGIKHILKEAGIEGKKITPYEIGFIIAPRINASGRLKNALDALRLLCTKDEKKAKNLALYVGKINRDRQDMVEKSLKEAKNFISCFYNKKIAKQINFYSATYVEELTKKKESSPLSGNKNLSASELNLPKIIILISEKWHEGIIGLIASKITDEFYRPTIVMTKTDGHYKGSARSIKGFHMTNFLLSLKEFLVDVGGHEQASGFTIEEKKLKDFVKEALKKADKEISERILQKVFLVDLKIPLSKININLVKKLQNLEPFGIGNPEPIFYTQGILKNAKIFGKKNEHLKLKISDIEEESEYFNSSLKKFYEIEMTYFNKSYLFSKLSRNKKIKILYTLKINNFSNKEKITGNIIEIF